MGIVISRGSRAERPSVFWAYVWAPAPEGSADAIDDKGVYEIGLSSMTSAASRAGAFAI